MFGALDNTIVGSHTEREWSDLLDTWNWRCFYCAEPVQRNSPDPKHEATKDHMTPISRGGVNFIGNIVPACLRCNQLKGEKTVEEFRAERAWVLQENFTGNTMSAAPKTFPQGNAASATVEITRPAPMLTTLEVAAMWKRVLEDVATKKTMGDHRTDEWWKQRRAMLKRQAEGIKRRTLEAAGQLTLPIFGEGTAKKLAQTEASSLPFRGMEVEQA